MKKLILLSLFLSQGVEAGILPNSRGGTSANLTPVAGSVLYSTSSQFQLTNAGSLGQVLQGGAVTSWSSAVISILRVATTTPITASATADFIIIAKLSASSAVGVSLPASPTTGLQYYIVDGKGDANTNNITITPAAGQINGASTLVINTAYGTKHIVYTGTAWNSM